MRRRLTVTGRTAATNMGVIHGDHRNPLRHRMAGVTNITTGDVRGMLAFRGSTVVASPAIADHLGMIHFDCRCPCQRVMAGLTLLGTADMTRAAAAGDGTVMTVGTADPVFHQIMVKVGDIPIRRGAMTIFTGQAGGYMTRSFTRC